MFISTKVLYRGPCFNAASFAKTIIICENNYSHENNQRFIVDVRQGSEYASDFEYESVLNIAGF